jgi:hypothetical protein
MAQKPVERIADNMLAQNIQRGLIGRHNMVLRIHQNTGFTKQFSHVFKAFGQSVHNVTHAAIHFASTCRLPSNQWIVAQYFNVFVALRYESYGYISGGPPLIPPPMGIAHRAGDKLGHERV